MSVFGSRRALRRLAPSAAAVIVVGGGAAAGTIVASAAPSLPERSAAQLLVDLGHADLDGLSGTIVESADLGLPAIAGLATRAGTRPPGGAADLFGLFAGNSTARVWHAGENLERLSLLSAQGETDLIQNGSDVWLWSSTDQKASHLKLPPGRAAGPPAGRATGLPVTPQAVADAVLAAIGPATKVTTAGVARVAGRDAYQLVLSPWDPASLIGQVSLAIDAVHHVPLRVDVYPRNATSPGARVAFQQISFTVPDAGQFAFNPPPGTTVSTGDRDNPTRSMLGTGWTSVIKTRLPESDGRPLHALITSLPKVSGSWGSGHLFAGTLLSVLILDDGTVYAGAVSPARLYQAAAG